MNHAVSVFSLLAVAGLAGCGQGPATVENGGNPETESVATINEHCPIMGGAATEDGGRFEWNGQMVGFCCPDCIEKFDALSDEEKAAALAKADDSHVDHDHGNEADDDEAIEASS